MPVMSFNPSIIISKMCTVLSSKGVQINWFSVINLQGIIIMNGFNQICMLESYWLEYYSPLATVAKGQKQYL